MVSKPPSCGPPWAISSIPRLLHVHGDSTTVRNYIAATALLGIPHLRASIQVTTLPKHRSCPDLLVATRINRIQLRMRLQEILLHLQRTPFHAAQASEDASSLAPRALLFQITTRVT